MIESCEIYITGVTYEGMSWVDDPDSFLELLYNNFNEIPHFYFVSISVNMAQVYNVNLKSSNYETMTVYLKGIKFEHQEFLSLELIRDLEKKLKEQLDYIEKLVFKEIEFRTSALYMDKELTV